LSKSLSSSRVLSPMFFRGKIVKRYKRGHPRDGVCYAHIIPTKVPELREKMNITQEQLAEISGVRLRSIQLLEGGELVTFSCRLKILRAFKLSPDAMEEIFPPHPPPSMVV